MKKALIFGVTGQDGSYLSRFLLSKKYQVHGVKRKSSSLNTSRIDDIYQEPFKRKNSFFLHYGDVTDGNSIINLIQKILPDEIYNLAAQSHVAVSFELPEYTAEVNAIGALKILEAIRITSKIKKIKYYQAGTSEMFGGISKLKQNEQTVFYPKSPYGSSKVFAHWITKNYREAYKLFACNGILFNHESPLRGETFVTKKIIQGLCSIKNKKKDILYIGNLYSKRDWGFAGDYVEAMWKMLQQKKPNDYVIATGNTISIKSFINLVCQKLKIDIVWKGEGINEKGLDKKNNKVIIKCHKKYFRPLEVEYLVGDSQKARKELKWKPKVSLDKLIDLMILHEINNK